MKIAVLGAGSIGSRHIKNLEELGHNVDVYDPQVCESNRESVVRWAEAVVIATPTANHYDDIDFCYHQNRPMFVEKPLVATVGDLARVPINTVKMVGYNLRFHSCAKKAKQIMGVGGIGRPLWARFTCAQYNDRDQYRRDGVILNWSHEIDLAIYLLGVAYHVATITNPEESQATMVLCHERTKCSTTIYLDYLTKPERRGFMIVGDAGAIEADLVTRQLFVRGSDGKICEVFAGRDSFDGNYLDEMRKFIDRLNGKEVIGCTAAEALIVNGLCLEAKRNAYVR